MDMIRDLIELAAQGIETFAVAIIVIAIVHGTIRYLIRINQQAGDAYGRLKDQLGKARDCWCWRFWWRPTSSGPSLSTRTFKMS